LQVVGVDETRTTRIVPRPTATCAASSTHASHACASSAPNIGIVNVDEACIIGSGIAAVESLGKAEVAGVWNRPKASIHIGSRVDAAVPCARGALADSDDP
jgi:hypothetical protein